MAENKKQTGDVSKLSFEQAITALTDIVGKIEKGDVPLQDSLDQYEKGMTLIKHCRSLLQTAEKRIEVISQQDDAGSEKGTAKQ
jgi:exodeoxyribonuclease VII small subunit